MSKRVLIVDDEEDLVSTLAERLDLRGIEVNTATNGTDALECLRGEDFSVLILDVKMPGMGGLALLTEIKRIRPEVPVILFTGYGSVADAEKGMEEGAFDYLMKPIDIDQLMEKIRKAAGLKESPES